MMTIRLMTDDDDDVSEARLLMATLSWTFDETVGDLAAEFWTLKKIVKPKIESSKC